MITQSILYLMGYSLTTPAYKDYVVSYTESCVVYTSPTLTIEGHVRDRAYLSWSLYRDGLDLSYREVSYYDSLTWKTMGPSQSQTHYGLEGSDITVSVNVYHPAYDTYLISLLICEGVAI